MEETGSVIRLSENNKVFVILKLFAVILRSKGWMWGRGAGGMWSNHHVLVRLGYEGCGAPGESRCRASCRFSVLFLPLCFAQISFCCRRCSQVLADTVKCESFKQLHLDTQLTHSIDFFIHHGVFFFLSFPSFHPSCTVCFLKVRRAAGRPLSEILGGAPPSGVARLKIHSHG